jgi:hypothetical protein
MISYSQETTGQYLHKNHYMGFNAGALTGIGFSYRYMPKKTGVQLTGLPAGNKHNLRIKAALTVFYKYYSSVDETLNLLAYASSSFVHKRNEIYYGIQPYEEYFIFEPQYINKYNAGIGTAMEIRLHNILSLDILLGYGIYDFTDNYRFTIDGGIGLFFRL